MEFQLSDFETYRDYFQDLATRSKDLNGAFIHGDIELVQEEVGSWEGIKLWAWPAVKGRLRDANSDNYLLNREGMIWIGGPAPEGHAQQDAYYYNCELIMKKIVAKMMQDKRDALIEVEFDNNAFDRAETYAGSTLLTGCQYTFTIIDPNGFEYNQDDWNS